LVRTRQSGFSGTRLARFAHRQAALAHATAFCAFPLRHEPYVESGVPRNKLPSDSGLKKRNMHSGDAKELRDELNRLLAEEIESLKRETFGGLDQEEHRQQRERLKRIREVAADYLAALKRSNG
jgi:DNA primase large subunit